MVGLDPIGRVARHAVLPGGEPEENEIEVVLARVFEEAVDKREVEFSFLRLEEIPTDGNEHSIQMKLLQVSPVGRRLRALCKTLLSL